MACDVPDAFKPAVPVCFSDGERRTDLSWAGFSTDAFGPTLNASAGPAWKWQSEAELAGEAFWGALSRYPGEGKLRLADAAGGRAAPCSL